MPQIIVLILGIIIGIVFAGGFSVCKKKLNKEERILGLFKDKHKITNNQVQELLGISDATATRYLDKLEKKGLLRQIGDTGKYVYYKKVNGSCLSR